MAEPTPFHPNRRRSDGPSFDGSSAPRMEPLSPAEVGDPGIGHMHPTPAAEGPAGLSGALWPYVQMARVDHWFKNAFMLLGVLIAVFHRPELLNPASAVQLGIAVLLTCVLASANYVLNEFLDAPLDRLHPTKRWRPAARGLVKGWAALSLWGGLAGVAIFGGFAINPAFGAVMFVFWVMACAYNIPPLRTKDVAYLDVISESINNPLRLFLGWFALIPDMLPPISLALAYWMLGAFFMAAKRYAEYRRIDDPERAASYRRSFAHYDDARLMASMFFYVAVGSVFSGVYLVRYKLELVLCIPVVAAFLGYYALLSTREDSPVQNPEKLYRERPLMIGALIVLTTFVGLMLVDIPALYDVFNVRGEGTEQLWSLPS